MADAAVILPATLPEASAQRFDLAGVLVALTQYGPPSEVRSQAPALAARCLGFDRVLLSSARAGQLVAESLYLSEKRSVTAVLAALHENPVPLEYPLLEGEIFRRQRAQVVRVQGRESAHAFADVLGWTEYVAAPVSLDSRVIGFLHADCDLGDRALSEHDADSLAAFAVAFALVHERAVLRTRLRGQLDEMRQVAAWADARTGELGDRLVSLEPEDGHSHRSVIAPGKPAADRLRDLLTRREIDVLELMATGETNAGIARELVLSPGTVKFHVKNILRKLHAANRGEAASRYLRLTLDRN